MRTLRTVPTALLVCVAASTALAQPAPKPEAVIKWRQSSFQTIAWNTGRIKASLTGTYNKDEVLKAASTIAAIANSGMFTGLFVPGTEHGKGWHDTATRPEAFKDGKRFVELGMNFSKEASELARLAAAADAAAVREQFGKLSKSCKACHEDYKVD